MILFINKSDFTHKSFQKICSSALVWTYLMTKLAVQSQKVVPVDLAPKLAGQLNGLYVKKIKNPKPFFWPKSTFAQQLGLESICGENLEFFQLKPPLKLFSMGTFSGPKKYRKFSKISKIPKKKRQKIPGMGEESSKNGFGPFFQA